MFQTLFEQKMAYEYYNIFIYYNIIASAASERSELARDVRRFGPFGRFGPKILDVSAQFIGRFGPHDHFGPWILDVSAPKFGP